MEYSLPIDSLKSILSTANTLQTFCSSRNPLTPNISSRPLSIHAFLLPHPSPIFDRLESLGLSSSAARKLSDAYIKSALRFRDFLHEQYRSTCQRASLTQALGTQLSASFTLAYNAKLKGWETEIFEASRKRLSKQTQAASPPDESSKKQFNNDFIPLLESFFEENQFPSRADKKFLASKSNMSYRQIHVWFQNRRSRSRKANSKFAQTAVVLGETMKSPLPPTSRDNTFWDLDEDTDVDEVADEREDQLKLSFSSRSSSFTVVAEDKHPFENDVPSYSYPTKYPPEFDVDPFPCRNGKFTCASIEWSRKPSAKEPKRSAIDIPELEASFAKLRLSDVQVRAAPLPTSRWGLHEPTEKTGCDVMGPFTVRPLRAPLFAFIPARSQSASKPAATTFATTKTRFRATTPSRVGSAEPPASTPVKKSTKKISGPARRVPVSSPSQRKRASPSPSPAPQVDTSSSPPARSASSSSNECATTSSRALSDSSSSSSSSVPSPITPVNTLPQPQDFNDLFGFTYNSAIPQLKDSFAFDFSSSNQATYFPDATSFFPSFEQPATSSDLDFFGLPSF